MDYKTVNVGVGVIIVNPKNEILLCKRGKKSRNEVGRWDLIGGAIEYGETVFEAAQRECQEEVNLEVEQLEKVDFFDHILPSQHWVSILVLASSFTGELAIMENGKIDQLGWYKIGEMPDRLTVSTILALDCYNKWLQFDKASSK